MNIIYKHKRIFRDIYDRSRAIAWTNKHHRIRNFYSDSLNMNNNSFVAAAPTFFVLGWLRLRNRTYK